MTPSKYAPEKINLCVVGATQNELSQTFITNHIKHLPFQVVPLYSKVIGSDTQSKTAGSICWSFKQFVFGDYLPNRTSDSKRLLSNTGKVIDQLFGVISQKERHPFWNHVFTNYLNNSRIDCVLAEFAWTGVRVMRACKKLGIPLIVHFHGSDAFKNSWLKKYENQYPHLFDIASKIVVVSKDMESQVIRLGAPRAKVCLNPYGVDASLFRSSCPGDNPPCFISVGRFTHKKGPEYVLDSFYQAYRENSELRLIMVGNGTLLNACKKKVEVLNISHAVEFPGFLSQVEVSRLMQSCRALIQHSITANSGDSEGTPLAVLEAGASGLPIIATRHGGIKECVRDGLSGYLSAEKDTTTMGKNILRIANSPTLAAEMGACSRKHILHNYTLDISISRLAKIIESAVTDHNRI